MEDETYFAKLYEIASDLNKAFSLPTALRSALVNTIELLELETGWIWLTQPDNKSVYLAASHNLPPALAQHPERLSGYCYCIKKYLSDEIGQATNISEITCTRLKDLSSETLGMKFHATIPIYIDEEKVGIMNLICPNTHQLEEKQLSILNTISELIAMAVRRTRLNESFAPKDNDADSSIKDVLKRVVYDELHVISSDINKLTALTDSETMREVNAKIGQLQKQVGLLIDESSKKEEEVKEEATFHYPASPLTRREIDVLKLVKEGLTNASIAEQLYISERTVKFHLTSIMSKLYAKTRTEAVNTALKRGLV